MSQLSNLPEDEALKIISLPYKAGMWISHADDVDGEADDINEMKALERGIPQLAKMHEGSALVQQVANDILAMKDHWAKWEDECFFVTKQAPDIIGVIKTQFGLAEAKQYRAFTMELGKMVAQAASELDAFDDEQPKEDGFFGSMIGKIVGGMSGVSQDHKDHPANISPAEGSALSELSAALAVSE